MHPKPTASGIKITFTHSKLKLRLTQSLWKRTYLYYIDSFNILAKDLSIVIKLKNY